MASDQASESRKLEVTGVDKEVNFESLVTAVNLIADGDCFVAFDENADTGSFLCKANVYTGWMVIPFTRLHAITSGGTANLYIQVARSRQ